MTDLLPINATSQERALALSTARISDVPVLVKNCWNPLTCPEAVLPWLAWSLSVTPWNSGWTVTQKRNVIATSIANHRIKGSVQSVKEAANAFGAVATIVEWWQTSPQGTPFTFTAQLSVPSISADVQASIVEAILSVKPARCSGTVTITNNADLQIAIGCYLRAARFDRFDGSLSYS